MRFLRPSWRAISLLVCCALLASVGVSATVGEDLVAADDNLTVQETLNAVAFRLHMNPLDWHIYARANRDAKPMLLELITRSSACEAKPTALRILAYIADEDDVASIVESVTRNLRGVVSDCEGDSIRAMLDCLGIMAGRGIEAAANQLRMMAAPAFWEETPYKVVPDWTPDHGGKYAEHELRASSWALQGFARGVGIPEDLDALRAGIIEHAEHPKIRQRLAGELSEKHLRRLWQKRIMKEKEVVSQEERREVALVRRDYADFFAKHLDILSVADLSNAEHEFARTVIDEALREYEAITQYVERGEMRTASERLLDDGERIDARKITRLHQEFEKELAREAEILKRLDDIRISGLKVQPTEFEIVRQETYLLPWQESPIESVTKSREITVTFRLGGSTELGTGYFPRRGHSLTVAKDGTLIVVMKKINGKWYWNPFGW